LEGENWYETLNEEITDQKYLDYLNSLPPEIPSVQWVWDEMDRIWNHFNLDNTMKLSDEDLKNFYSHPVWLMNGIFTMHDPESYEHRKSIASYLKERDLHSIADYGGGSGILAETIVKSSPQSAVDIIEPFAFDAFKQRLRDYEKINYRNDFAHDNYDVAIAQDVLEHVDNPLEVAYKISSN
jgi:2-polyprenyl-6-hydroxyphenyl methylase/3-demethylubiquinone-9 3-methyltransferase